MAPDHRGERLQIMLTEAELISLDNFRFKNRMPSRAAAVRELLRRGLAAEGLGDASFGGKSSDYGVTDGGQFDGLALEPPPSNNGRKPAK